MSEKVGLSMAVRNLRQVTFPYGLPDKALARPSGRARALAACLLLVAAVLLFARCFFWAGFWGDEPYGLSTAFRYYLGERPFVDSWDTNFSSAIIALPFVHLFMKINGSTDGILLAYRGVFFAMTALTAVTAVRALKDVLSWWLAIAIGMLLMLYVPVLSPFVGYGADVLWHMLASLVAVALLVNPKRGVVNALPGALCAMGILGNPPTVVVVPFFACALWLGHRRAPGSDPRRALGWYLGGGGVVGLLFLVVLMTLGGPNVFASIRQVSSPDDHDFGVSAQLARLWFARWVLAVPLLVGVSLGAVRRTLPDRWRAWVTPAAFLGCLSLALWAIATQRIMPFPIAPQSLVFAVGTGLFLTHVISGTARVAGWQWLLVLPAVGSGLGWFIGSNGGVGTAVVASPLILAAALGFWPQPESGKGDVGENPHAGVSAAILLAVSIVATAAFGMLNTPGGGMVTSMTARIERGPFRGILTTPHDAAMHASVLESVERLSADTGRVVFFERFPLGYLITGSLPGTYSTWATSATSSRLNEYMSLTGNRPSRVVLTRFRAVGDDGFPTDVSLTGFPSDYVQVYSDDNLKVFDRRGK